MIVSTFLPYAIAREDIRGGYRIWHIWALCLYYRGLSIGVYLYFLHFCFFFLLLKEKHSNYKGWQWRHKAQFCQIETVFVIPLTIFVHYPGMFTNNEQRKTPKKPNDINALQIIFSEQHSLAWSMLECISTFNNNAQGEETKMSGYKTKTGLEIKTGNLKIGHDTLILNMGSASECPSKARGLCKLGKKCYAWRDEKRYHKAVPQYRKRQEEYWKKHTGKQILDDISELLTSRKRQGKSLYKSIKYLRMNEAGDFWCQKCIDKLNIISAGLAARFGIVTYTYTARKDLDFSDINFTVKASSWHGPHGTTIARPKSRIGKSTVYIEKATLYTVCPMDCRKCDVCKVTKRNVVFPLH